jgi:hypothetical protein
MLKSKPFWYFMMLGALAGWAFSILGIAKPFKNEKLRKLWASILCTWALGHPFEIFMSSRIGKKMGLSFFRTATKTLLFGFTWWLPLKLGVIKK